MVALVDGLSLDGRPLAEELHALQRRQFGVGNQLALFLQVHVFDLIVRIL